MQSASRSHEVSCREPWLLDAVVKGDLVRVIQLVEGQANVNACDDDQRTGLHLACFHDHSLIAQYLIAMGANLNLQDRWGSQPLQYAMLHGNRNVISSLTRAGALLSASCKRDLEFKMCQHAAEGNLQGVKTLVEVGVSINALNYDQRSPLHLASANGFVEIVQYLLLNGGDASSKDRLGRIPIQDAIHEGHHLVVQCFVNAAAGDAESLDVKKRKIHGVCDTSPCESNSKSARHMTNKQQTMRGSTMYDMDANSRHHSSWECPASLAKSTDSSCPSYVEKSSKTSKTSESTECSPRDVLRLMESISAANSMDRDSITLAEDDMNDEDKASPFLRERRQQVAPLNPAGVYKHVGAPADLPRTLSRSNSMQFNTHVAERVTVIFIDIKGFTARCAEMSARQVGEWVAEFYGAVDRAADAHGVRKVEVRGDCCICVSADRGGGGAAAAAAGQVVRALAFAAALHADLSGMGPVGAQRTSARVGMATGNVAYLLADPAAADSDPEDEACGGGGGGGGGRGGRRGFASVQGDTVNLAARMEALSSPGAAVLHKSAADRWAAEAGRPAPPTACVEVKGRGLQRAAVFDCAAGGFAKEFSAFFPEAGLRSLSGYVLPPPLRRADTFPSTAGEPSRRPAAAGVPAQAVAALRGRWGSCHEL